MNEWVNEGMNERMNEWKSLMSYKYNAPTDQ